MKCCEKCFKDSLIQDTITKLGVVGNCDFCGSKNVHVYDISYPNLISDKITELLQIYEESNDEEAKVITSSLRDDWDIFSGDEQSIADLLKTLCPHTIKGKKNFFEKKVIVPQAKDDAYLDEYGVVKGLEWSQFSEKIKYENRFHSTEFNRDQFASYLSLATKILPVEQKFYRARIAQNKTGFEPKDMYAPPKEFRRAGRVNPEGIGVLYLSSNMDTALNEVRASTYDYVSVGEFIAVKNIRAVDLSSISKISPFLYDGDIERFFINRKVFKDLATEIAKPLRRNDSVIEYLPTQYISEFIKSQGYDGVAYDSTLSTNGYNIAIYDEKMFNCVNVKTVEVKQIKFKYE